jgi:predicted NAD/FAD-binding protein
MSPSDVVRYGSVAQQTARRSPTVTRTERFDACVIATHADEALAALAAPDPLERELLSAFAYQRNRAALHADVTHMPRRRRIWSSRRD